MIDNNHKNTPGPYDDIINMEHPVSKRHPQMSMSARAAQFAPFAALAGHDAAIRATAQQNTEFFEKQNVRDEEFFDSI